MGNLGFQEILLIAVVVLVLFGGRKIPEFMRGLGKGIREFNDAKNNVKKRIRRRYQRKRYTSLIFISLFSDKQTTLAFVSVHYNQRLS